MLIVKSHTIFRRDDALWARVEIGAEDERDRVDLVIARQIGHLPRHVVCHHPRIDESSNTNTRRSNRFGASAMDFNTPSASATVSGNDELIALSTIRQARTAISLSTKITTRNGMGEPSFTRNQCSVSGV